jgi:16S rRNA processing protein RimM
VRGKLTVHVDNEGSDVLEGVDEVYLERESGEVEALGLRGASRARPGRWRVSLAGIDSREQASSLTGRTIMVSRDALGMAEGELLVSELPGRQVVADGEQVGVVRSVYHNGAHDVLVVEADPGLVDVPLVEQHVAGLDGQGRLVIDDFRSFAELAYPPAEGRKR